MISRALTWRFFLVDNLRKNLGKGGFGQGADFIVAAVLNGMLYVTGCRLESERFALGGGGFNELGRGDKHARDAAQFQIGDVVHTARGA